MPAIRAQEAPEALAATVLPAKHCGCLRRAGADIRKSLHPYHSRIGEIRGGLGEGGCMPRRKSLVTVIRDMVQQEVRSAIQSLLGSVSSTKPKAKNGRRRRPRRTRGTWRPGGPGRPPKAVAAKMARKKVPTPVARKAKTVRRRRRRRRGPGRAAGSKTKAA